MTKTSSVFFDTSPRCDLTPINDRSFNVAVPLLFKTARNVRFSLARNRSTVDFCRFRRLQSSETGRFADGAPSNSPRISACRIERRNSTEFFGVCPTVDFLTRASTWTQIVSTLDSEIYSAVGIRPRYHQIHSIIILDIRCL